MTDRELDNIVEGGEVDLEAIDSTSKPQGLREKEKRLEKENAELRAKLRDAAFQQAGIDTEEGIGKAVAQLYEGEADVDAIVAFAQEYGWEKPAVTPEAAQVHSSTENIADVVAASTPMDEPEDVQVRIANLEAEGKYEEALNLKMQTL